MGIGQISPGKVKTRISGPLKVRQGGRQGMGAVLFTSKPSLRIRKGLRVSVWEDEKVPKTDGGDGRTTT